MYKEYCKAILKSLGDAVSNYPSDIHVLDANAVDFPNKSMSLTRRDGCFIAVFNQIKYNTEPILDGEPIPILQAENGTRLFDYRQTMPININTVFMITTPSIEKNIEIEELIVSFYSIPYKLDVHTSKGESLDLELYRIADIRRNPVEELGTTFFKTIIEFKEIEAFYEDIDYHQAQIDFDSTVQKEIMGRIVALQETGECIRKKLPPQMQVEGIDTYTPSEGDLELKKRADYYEDIAGKKLELLRMYPEELRAPFFCKKVYEYAINKKVSLIDAVNKLKEKDELSEKSYKKYLSGKMNAAKKAEKDRLEDIASKNLEQERAKRKIESFETKGDIVRNTVLDTIMRDIIQRTGMDSKWTVFNGTDYMQYRKSVEEKRLPDLWISIESNDRYRFPNDSKLAESAVEQFEENVSAEYPNAYDSERSNERRVFPNYEGNTFQMLVNGNRTIQYYNHIALPIEYNVRLELGCESEIGVDTLDRTVSRIIDVYRNPVTCSAKVLGVDNQFIRVDLQIETEEKEQESTPNKKVVVFKPIRTPYIRNNAIYNDIEKDPRIQQSLLKQAEHKLAMYSTLRFESFKETKGALVYCCSPNILGNMIVPGLKQFKKSILQRCPDFELYKKLFPVLSDVYPILMDRLLAGWSYEQICSEIESLANTYRAGYENDINLLGTCIGNQSLSIEKDDRVLNVLRDIAKVNHLLRKKQDPCMFLDEAFEVANNKRGLQVSALIKSLRKYGLEATEVDDRDSFYSEEFDDVGAGNKGFRGSISGHLRDHITEPSQRDYYGGGRRYEDDYPRERGSRFLDSVASSYLANKGVERELKKQTKLMEKQEKERIRREGEEKARIRRENALKEGKEKFEHNQYVDRIMKENEKRRLKGLPELPVPPKRY